MLEQWQAQKINEKIRPILNYLGRLKTRMEKTGRQNGKLLQIRVQRLRRSTRSVRGLALFVVSGRCVPRARGVGSLAGAQSMDAISYSHDLLVDNPFTEP
jgi:hypothetical protein